MAIVSPLNRGCGTPSKWPFNSLHKWGVILTIILTKWDDPPSIPLKFLQFAPRSHDGTGRLFYSPFGAFINFSGAFAVKLLGSTLPETNSSPLKSYLPNRKGLYSNHPFSGVNLLLVSGRVINITIITTSPTGHHNITTIESGCPLPS